MASLVLKLLLVTVRYFVAYSSLLLLCVHCAKLVFYCREREMPSEVQRLAESI